MQYAFPHRSRRHMNEAEKALNIGVAGIYQIRCLATGDLYVGATKTLRFRYQTHSSSLKTGYHSNSLLQAAYIKYGADNFVFELLEDIGVLGLKDDALTSLLVERERHWTAKLNPAYCRHRSRYFHRCKEGANRGQTLSPSIPTARSRHL